MKLPVTLICGRSATGKAPLSPPASSPPSCQGSPPSRGASTSGTGRGATGAPVRERGDKRDAPLGSGGAVRVRRSLSVAMIDRGLRFVRFRMGSALRSGLSALIRFRSPPPLGTGRCSAVICGSGSAAPAEAAAMKKATRAKPTKFALYRSTWQPTATSKLKINR